MDANTLITLIGSLGFPIVAAIGVGWYCMRQSDASRADMKEMQAANRAEIAKVTEALNNNTLVIQKLVDKLDKEDDGK